MFVVYSLHYMDLSLITRQFLSHIRDGLVGGAINTSSSIVLIFCKHTHTCTHIHTHTLTAIGTCKYEAMCVNSLCINFPDAQSRIFTAPIHVCKGFKRCTHHKNKLQGHLEVLFIASISVFIAQSPLHGYSKRRHTREMGMVTIFAHFSRIA